MPHMGGGLFSNGNCSLFAGVQWKPKGKPWVRLNKDRPIWQHQGVKPKGFKPDIPRPCARKLGLKLLLLCSDTGEVHLQPDLMTDAGSGPAKISTRSAIADLWIAKKSAKSVRKKSATIGDSAVRHPNSGSPSSQADVVPCLMASLMIRLTGHVPSARCAL